MKSGTFVIDGKRFENSIEAKLLYLMLTVYGKAKIAPEANEKLDPAKPGIGIIFRVDDDGTVWIAKLPEAWDIIFDRYEIILSSLELPSNQDEGSS